LNIKVFIVVILGPKWYVIAVVSDKMQKRSQRSIVQSNLQSLSGRKFHKGGPVTEND